MEGGEGSDGGEGILKRWARSSKLGRRRDGGFHFDGSCKNSFVDGYLTVSQADSKPIIKCKLRPSPPLRVLICVFLENARRMYFDVREVCT